MAKKSYLSVDYAYPSSSHAEQHGGPGYYAAVQSVLTGRAIAGPYGPFQYRESAVHKAVLAVNEARAKGWHVRGIDDYMAALGSAPEGG